MYRCDVGDNEAITGNRRWATDELTWRDAGVRYPGTSFLASQEYVRDMVAQYCGLALRIVQQSANLVSRFRLLDGRGRVLARHELPGMPSGQHEQLNGEWDSSERPSQRILDIVTAHEVMHGLGLIHFNTDDSLMNANLDAQWHSEWDNWTIDELRSRYGAPRTVVPGPVCDWGKLCNELCGNIL